MEIKDLLKDIEKVSFRFYKHNFKQRQFWDKQKDKWSKRKKNYNHPPLENTGHLYNSFKSSISNNEITISNTADYAIFHNEGTGKIPQRQFLGESKELNNRIEKMIEKYLDKEFDNLF